jgi:hypothetical protein
VTNEEARTGYPAGSLGSHDFRFLIDSLIMAGIGVDFTSIHNQRFSPRGVVTCTARSALVLSSFGSTRVFVTSSEGISSGNALSNLASKAVLELPFDVFTKVAIFLSMESI